MRTAFLTFLAFLAGLFSGYVTAILLYIILMQVSGSHDFEGAGAMGVAFVIGPAVALIAGVGAAILAYRKLRSAAD